MPENSASCQHMSTITGKRHICRLCPECGKLINPEAAAIPGCADFHHESAKKFQHIFCHHCGERLLSQAKQAPTVPAVATAYCNHLNPDTGVLCVTRYCVKCGDTINSSIPEEFPECREVHVDFIVRGHYCGHCRAKV